MVGDARKFPIEEGDGMAPVTMPRQELARERTGDERDRAQRRLEDALQRKHRSSARLDAAQGTRDELDAFVQLQEDEEEVAARDRWIEWADGEDIVPPWPDFLPLHRLLG
jgi:hypothetical protein